jgi:hypothetical protein
MIIKQITFYCLSIWIIACQQNSESTEVVTLDLPQTLYAGQKVIIPAFSSGKLIVKNSIEVLVFEHNTADSLLLDRAGKYIFEYFVNGQIQFQKNIVVLPQEVASATLLVGGKSIVANGKSMAMAVLLPEDRFHNSYLTTARFSALRPQQNIEESFENQHHLVVYKNIISQTLSGKTLVSANVGTIETAPREITEVAGEPVDFKINAIKIVADYNQYFKIMTNTLKDIFGNIVEDGTIVELWLTDNKQTQTHLEAYTLNGVAVWSVKNPDEAGLIVVKAQSSNALSNELKISFLPVKSSKLSLE